MSYDPNQPPGGNPPGSPYPGAYQPPEGTNPGAYPPPTPGATYPGGYVPPPGAPGSPGQQPQYPGQPQYYGTYPGPMAPSTSPWAIASLILSIASWLGLIGLGAILGVIFGHLALNEINKSEGRLEGRGMAIAGLIIGYAHLVIGLCALIAFIVFFVFAIGSQT